MLQIALLASQELIWRIMAAQKAGVAGRGAIQFVPHFDPRFAGGFTGMPGFESIVIPADWRTRLNPSNLDMLIVRRIAARDSGGWVLFVLWAMLMEHHQLHGSDLANRRCNRVGRRSRHHFLMVPVVFVRWFAVTAIDHALAKRGKSLFVRNSSQCHGTYGDDWRYPNARIPLNEINTDPVRLTALTEEGRKKYADGWFAHAGESDAQQTVTAPDGYVAPPLDGIWASAPYLHNGSVPTLWHLMHPDHRPTA